MQLLIFYYFFYITVLLKLTVDCWNDILGTFSCVDFNCIEKPYTLSDVNNH